MTVSIKTKRGEVKVITDFKVSPQKKRELKNQIKLLIDQDLEYKPASDLLKKLKKEDPLIGTPRGALVAYKNARSWTQQELSRLSKIPQSDLSKIINGKRPIGPVIAKKLADAFGVDYKKFL